MATQTAVLTKQPIKGDTLGGFLELRKGHLADMLPASLGLGPDKFIKLALVATKRQPKLLQCDMNSVFQALMNCAELGLDPSGVTGEASLVPYGKTCQLIIGYRGYIALARRSGQLKQIETHVVYSNDKFTLKYGLNPVLEHEPNLKDEPGEAMAFYCVARLADEAVHVEVMTAREVNRIRDESLSKAYDKAQSPWTKHYVEMARKTVVRRAAKYLPQSTELQRAIEHDDDIEGQVVGRSDAADAIEAPALPAQTQTEKVKAALAANTKKKPPAVVDVQTGETEEQATARVNELTVESTAEEAREPGED